MAYFIFLGDVAFRMLALLVFSCSAIGYGLGVLRLIRIRSTGEGLLGPAMVSGLGVIFVLLALIHWARPIDFWSATPVTLAGIILAAANFFLLKSNSNKEKLGSCSRRLLALFFLILLAFACGKSLLPPWHYDFGLYYQSTIKWNAEYPLVPGLGNLYSRLGFNQISFLLATWMNAGVFQWGASLVNIIFMVACLLTSFGWATGDENCRSKLIGRGFAWILGVSVFLISLAHTTMHAISSGAPDLASGYLQLAALSLFVRLTLTDCHSKDGPVTVVALCLVLALLPCIKLSNAIFGALLGLVILLFLCNRRSAREWRAVLIGGAIGAVVLAAWMHRGVMLSGYPLYPSEVLGLEVEWQVPAEVPRNEVAWIKSWAREPYTPPGEVLNSWDWLEEWWWMQQTKGMGNSFYPLIASAFGLGAWLALLCFVRRRNRQHLFLFGAAVAVAGSLVAWFMLAPDWRFSGGLLWGIPLLLGAWLLATEMFRTAFVVVGLWSTVQLAVLYASNDYTLTQWPIGWQAWRSDVGFKLHDREEVFFFLPVEGDQLFDAPLPATNNLPDRLEMRSADPLDGFEMAE